MRVCRGFPAQPSKVSADEAVRMTADMATEGLGVMIPHLCTDQFERKRPSRDLWTAGKKTDKKSAERMIRTNGWDDGWR